MSIVQCPAGLLWFPMESLAEYAALNDTILHYFILQVIVDRREAEKT